MALADDDAPRALHLAERLREAAPNSPVGSQLMGQARQKAGDQEGAIAAYRDAMVQGPTRPAALGLFQILNGKGEMAEAESVLEQWLETRPNDIEVRSLLAQYQGANGNLQKAIRNYERALEIAPERPTLLNNLAWLYLERGDSLALEYARRAYKLAPNRPEITDTYGWAHFRLGDTDKGLRLLQDAAVHGPHIPSIRYHLAAALAKAGRKEEARRELEQLLRNNADFRGAEEARQLLDSL
jgi:Flp pilus assembly protein TadD